MSKCSRQVINDYEEIASKMGWTNICNSTGQLRHTAAHLLLSVYKDTF